MIAIEKIKKNIYLLNSNITEFPFLMETSKNPEDYFSHKHFKWKNYDNKSYSFELMSSDTKKKNYNFDVSKYSSNLIIFSERAFIILKDILEKTGTFVNIKTDSKRKKFYGFYPNKNIYSLDIVDLSNSEYREANGEYLFYKIKLNNKAPFEDYLFALDEYFTGAYVTDKFKKIVEDNGLVGFDFTEIVYEED